MIKIIKSALINYASIVFIFSIEHRDNIGTISKVGIDYNNDNESITIDNNDHGNDNDASMSVNNIDRDHDSNNNRYDKKKPDRHLKNLKRKVSPTTSNTVPKTVVKTVKNSLNLCEHKLLGVKETRTRTKLPNEKVQVSKIPWHSYSKTSRGRKRNLLNSNVLDREDTGISPGKQVLVNSF